jgi:hypothetical protein
LVSTAANHANEAMKKIDKFKELLEVQEKISGAVDLVSPTRELLKEGKIVKISTRSGDHQERYLFLVSVSCCTNHQCVHAICNVADRINTLGELICCLVEVTPHWNALCLLVCPYHNTDNTLSFNLSLVSHFCGTR